MNQYIFRQNDIRGLVGKDLTDETVSILAKAVGTFFIQNGVQTVSIGYDARESSPVFSDIFIKNLNLCGLNVVNFGLIPTPLVYFSLFTEKVEAGVMITGSHNPSEFNGFKISIGKSSLHGEQIQQIKEIALSEKFSAGNGTVLKKDIVEKYLEYVRGNVKLGKRKLKVVVDAGNGVGGIIADPLYRELGCEVIELFIEPDSDFPHHHPDPTVPENMQDLIESVLRHQADLGIAFDGDADRIGLVDEKGKIMWGDEMMILLSRSILEKQKTGTFIAEVKCSQLMFDEIEKRGGKVIMARTGHSVIKAKMKETGAVLAGEMSGHIFFADRYFGFDDAIYAGARILEILSNSTKQLSEFLTDLPKIFNTPEIRIECSDDDKDKIVRRLTEEFKATHQVIDIDGARILFENGWGLVRSSSTQAMLILRFEADTKENLEKIRHTVESKLQNIIDKNQIPTLLKKTI